MADGDPNLTLQPIHSRRSLQRIETVTDRNRWQLITNRGRAVLTNDPISQPRTQMSRFARPVASRLNDYALRFSA